MNACLKQLFTEGTAFWGMGKVLPTDKQEQHNRSSITEQNFTQHKVLCVSSSEIRRSVTVLLLLTLYKKKGT
jgi:hypothetical protein